MATTKAGQHDTVSLIRQLSDSAKTVQKDDLSGLAKMHTWCEALAAAEAQGGESLPADVPRRAQTVAKLLEGIILGENADADAVLASIVAATTELAGLIGGVEAVAAGTEAAAPAEESIEKTPAREPAPPAEPTSEPTTRAEEEVYQSAPLKIDGKEMEFVRGFLEEAGEHIQAIEAAVLEVERAPDNAANIDNLFRPFHTIKGMAGFLNFRDINSLTHEAETLLDQARKGKRQVTPGLIDVVFDVVDILKAQLKGIAAYVADPKSETVYQPPVAEMIGKLRAVSAGRLEPGGREPAAGSATNKVGENLVEQGACAKEVVDIALDAQKNGAADRKTGEILMDMGVTTPKQVSQAIRPQAQARQSGPSASATNAAAGDQSIRVDTAKLDGLVDVVGELVIAQTLVGANSRVAADSKLARDVDQVDKIVRNVQEMAMSLRMMPIGPTFQKMARVVRDVARKAGKQVELVISGEETELDKNVIQQIGDPLIHMVRNAVDHGIEPPEVRRSLGKSEVGIVNLRASHQGGNIAIEVQDDGRGLDPKALVAKAIEKGLVQPGEELTDQQAFALIFAPGFSMAQKVTDISGRGVGMDVVRRNIDQLRGKVEIASTLGKGSVFTIRLPLTLAIIDGMIIKVGKERFIIPTIAIEQALRPLPRQITSVQHRGEVLNVRGRLIPLIQLGELFKLSKRVDPCQAMVVIAHCEGRQIGLVVDELIGQQQVVIKTLGERFSNLRGICGAAILGDGRVGLILEITGLMALHAQDQAGDRCGPEHVPSSIAGRSDLAPEMVAT